MSSCSEQMLDFKDFSQNCQSVINPPPISHLVYNNRLVLLSCVFLCTKLAQLIRHCFPFDIKMFVCLCTLINALEWILNMCLSCNGSTHHRVYFSCILLNAIIPGCALLDGKTLVLLL